MHFRNRIRELISSWNFLLFTKQFTEKKTHSILPLHQFNDVNDAKILHINHMSCFFFGAEF